MYIYFKNPATDFLFLETWYLSKKSIISYNQTLAAVAWREVLHAKGIRFTQRYLNRLVFAGIWFSRKFVVEIIPCVYSITNLCITDVKNSWLLIFHAIMTDINVLDKLEHLMSYWKTEARPLIMTQIFIFISYCS